MPSSGDTNYDSVLSKAEVTILELRGKDAHHLTIYSSLEDHVKF